MTNRPIPFPSAEDERFDLAVYLFKEGTNRRAFQFLGAHPAVRNGRHGWEFVVWAPGARACAVVGDFSSWQLPGISMLRFHGDFWYAFADDLHEFDLYKYVITQKDGRMVYKADPFAFFSEKRPGTASRLYSLREFPWQDGPWLSYRRKTAKESKPLLIYELHIGSWKTDETGEPFSYTRLSHELIPYVKSMGYTHIELLPVMEHPLDASWGYQVTGFFAPTSRYGTPKDFMAFINECHKAGLGVILDWVGAHFPKDECGLYEFDGTRLYEYADDSMAEFPVWQTRAFDLGKNEVRSFLLSSALYWIEEYHVDGLRVDAVTYMLDHSASSGENTAAYEFLQRLNDALRAEHPDVITIAEESSDRRGVTAGTSDGGLGFDYKWNLGWMHDTLGYFAAGEKERSSVHDRITFPMSYAFSENFILPLSHDEVVHGKGSLIWKMAGSYDEKFALLRLLFAYMIALPGKKLSFMGNEFAHFDEWTHEKGLNFFLLDYPSHNAFHTYMRELNFFYLEHEALWQNDRNWEGFQWISPDDRQNGVIAFRRISDTQKELICVFHFAPSTLTDYCLGVPYDGVYSASFAVGNQEPLPPVRAEKEPYHSLPYRIRLTLPPYSALFWEVKRVPDEENFPLSTDKEVFSS